MNVYVCIPTYVYEPYRGRVVFVTKHVYVYQVVYVDLASSRPSLHLI